MSKVSDEYREARRRQVLNAARQCFARNGFHATTMPDILAEAGMSSGGVYRYFRSKDDIIVAIGQQNLQAVAAAVDEIAHRYAADGPGAILQGTLDFARRRHKHDQLGAMALLVWSESLRNETLAQTLRATFSDLRRSIVDALTSAGGPAASSSARPEDIATLMISVLAGYLLELVVLGPSITNAVPPVANSIFSTPT